jgi:formylmethanofuran dehydrogenase subunit C
MLILTPKYEFTVPIDVDHIVPDQMVNKTLNQIRLIPLWEGNRQKKLIDLFEIEFDGNAASDNVCIRMIGDLHKVKRIGAKMSQGRIEVEGNVGMRLGEQMVGGEIAVNGNAGSWAGMMMKGGTIWISGDAGDYLGAAYRGSSEGMRGGAMIIEGNAGNEVGCFMIDGTIQIRGNVGGFTGMHMRGGAILVQGNAGARIGAEMMGGRIVVLGTVPSILPGFFIDRIRPRVRVGEERIQGPFYLFKGDVPESWNGSLYVSLRENPHLKSYEEKMV